MIATKNIHLIVLLTILIPIIVLSNSCTTTSSWDTASNPVSMLFETYVKDIQKSASVIHKYDLIANLTHLLKMDNGGQKYYIIEHEHITEMLDNVTQQFYDDIIITNSYHIIVYSMKNIQYCGQRLFTVSPTLHQFILTLSYKDISIYRPFEYPALSRSYSFCIFYPIIHNDRNRGFLIGIINQDKLQSLLPKDTIIIQNNGEVIFDITKNPQLKLDEESLSKEYIIINNKKYKKTFLSYKNIQWYILYP